MIVKILMALRLKSRNALFESERRSGHPLLACVRGSGGGVVPYWTASRARVSVHLSREQQRNDSSYGSRNAPSESDGACLRADSGPVSSRSGGFAFTGAGRRTRAAQGPRGEARARTGQQPPADQVDRRDPDRGGGLQGIPRRPAGQGRPPRGTRAG